MDSPEVLIPGPPLSPNWCGRIPPPPSCSLGLCPLISEVGVLDTTNCMVGATTCWMLLCLGWVPLLQISRGRGLAP